MSIWEFRPRPDRASAILASLFAMLMVSGVTTAWTQEIEPTLIASVVTDEGEPLAGAEVTIAGSDGTAVTDSDGRAVFEGVAAGDIEIHVRALGWASERVETRVEPGSITRIDIALKPMTVEAPRIDVELDRFRVVGRPEVRSRIPGSAQILGREQLDGSFTLHDDIHAFLRQVPGVNVQEEDGYGLRPNIGIRGTGLERSSKIALMEDGVLIAPAPYAAPSAYYFPVAGRMSAIEVRKGSSQIKFGPHTIGGAVNLVSTPIPDDFRWFARLEGGEDETGKVWVGVGDMRERIGWLAETYQVRTDGFKRIDSGGDTGFEIEDYRFKFRLQSSPDAPRQQALDVKIGWYDEISDETYLGLTEEDFRTSPFRRYPASQNDVMRADHRQIQARHAVAIPGAFDLTTVVYRNDFARNWFKLEKVDGVAIADVLRDPATHAAELDVLRGQTSSPDALTLRNNNREYASTGVQSVLGVGATTGAFEHDLEIGARYHEDYEDRFQHEDLFRMISGQMVRTTAGEPGSQSNRVSEADAWAFFAQDRIAAGRWTVTPGLRYETIDFRRTDYAGDDPGRIEPERIREHHVTAWVPGIGIGFETGAGIDLFAGVHRGFGPPGPSADEATEAEKSVNYEVGARYDSPIVAFEIAGFVNEYDNILGRATLSTGDPTGDSQLFNGGEARISGIEASIDAEPTIADRVRFPLRLAYTFTDAQFRSDFESEFEPWGTVESGDELPYVPRHQMSAAVGVERDPWKLELGLNRVGATRTIAGQGPIPKGEGTDSYTVWNLVGEISLTPRASFFGGVQNLTAEEYVVARRPAGARPGLARTLLAGLRIGT